ncbi:MAG: hypothetical protein ACI8TX_002856 [Hyphomicrobiaceae bacterium]|jgi:hypothetical protein
MVREALESLWRVTLTTAGLGLCFVRLRHPASIVPSLAKTPSGPNSLGFSVQTQPLRCDRILQIISECFTLSASF